MTHKLLKALQSNIFDLLEIQNLPPERKAQVLEKLTALLVNKILLAILDRLEEEDKSHFLSLLSTDETADAALTYAETKLGALQQIISEEAAMMKLSLKKTLDEKVSEISVLTELSESEEKRQE